jgi:hypothetical protein
MSGNSDSLNEADPNPFIDLGNAGVAVRGRGTILAHEEDVNEDGLTDLVVQVYTMEFGFDPDATEADLTAQANGWDIEVTDSICIRPPE